MFKSKVFFHVFVVFVISWLYSLKHTYIIKQTIDRYQLAFIIVQPRDRMYNNSNLIDYESK